MDVKMNKCNVVISKNNEVCVYEDDVDLSKFTSLTDTVVFNAEILIKNKENYIQIEGETVEYKHIGSFDSIYLRTPTEIKRFKNKYDVKFERSPFWKLGKKMKILDAILGLRYLEVNDIILPLRQKRPFNVGIFNTKIVIFGKGKDKNV